MTHERWKPTVDGLVAACYVDDEEEISYLEEYQENPTKFLNDLRKDGVPDSALLQVKTQFDQVVGDSYGSFSEPEGFLDKIAHILGPYVSHQTLYGKNEGVWYNVWLRDEDKKAMWETARKVQRGLEPPPLWEFPNWIKRKLGLP